MVLCCLGYKTKQPNASWQFNTVILSKKQMSRTKSDILPMKPMNWAIFSHNLHSEKTSWQRVFKMKCHLGCPKDKLRTDNFNPEIFLSNTTLLTQHIFHIFYLLSVRLLTGNQSHRTVHRINTVVLIQCEVGFVFVSLQSQEKNLVLIHDFERG